MYFNNESLHFLLSMEANSLAEVGYYYWVNKAKKNDIIRYIEYCELRFTNGSKLVLKYNDIDNTITVLSHFDSVELANQLKEEFGDFITIEYQPMKLSELWKDVLYIPIQHVLLNNEFNRYLSNQIVFEWSNKKIIAESTSLGLDLKEIFDI